MKKRSLKSMTLAMMMLLSAGAVFANNNDKTEAEYAEIIESLDEYSNEAYLEAHGLETETKVFVYDLDGSLVLEENEDDLSWDNYKIIFQSDLLMESSGDQYYIINK